MNKKERRRKRVSDLLTSSVFCESAKRRGISQLTTFLGENRNLREVLAKNQRRIVRAGVASQSSAYGRCKRRRVEFELTLARSSCENDLTALQKYDTIGSVGVYPTRSGNRENERESVSTFRKNHPDLDQGQ